MNPKRHHPPLALTCPINLLSQNINGLFTKIDFSSGKATRGSIILKYANTKSIDILAIQEPHLQTDAQRARAENIFATRGYSLLAPLSPEGRGGVATAWGPRWTLTNSFSIDPRTLITTFSDSDGNLVSILNGHFHHDPIKRKRQWATVSKTLANNPPPNLIFAADHNSIIVPSRDAAGPTTQNELPSILAARSEEVRTLSQLNLWDTWIACADQDLEGGGWTWGFPPPPPAQ